MIILIKFLATIKQWFWRLGDQAMPKESAKWVSSLEPHVFWSDVHSVAGWRPQDSCVRCPQWSDKQNFKSGICKWPVLDPTRKAMILWRNVGDHWRSFCSKCHYHRCAGQACWIGRSSEGISCCFWEKKMNENILRLAFAFLLLWEVLQFGKELLCFWKCFALRLTRGLNTKGLLRWIQKKSAVLTCFLAASFQSNAFAWPYEDFCCYFVGLYVNIQIWTFQLSTNL